MSLIAAACSDSDPEPGGGVGGSTGGSRASAGGDASSIGGTGVGVGGSNGGTGGTASNAGSGGTGNGGTGNGAPGDGGLGGDGPNPAGLGPAPVELGTAAGFAILAKSAISNVPTSKITGNIALSPAPASYITGFELTKGGHLKSTTPEVIGSVFAADNDPPTPIDLTTAVSDMQTAYTDAAGRPTPDFVELGAGTIGGLVLAPGLYKWTCTVTICPPTSRSPGPSTTSGSSRSRAISSWFPPRR